MSLRFRVRRATPRGLVRECEVDRLAKAMRVARQVVRETGRAVRIERKVSGGWEMAAELRPEVKTAVEEQIARGILPRVQNPGGRRGQVAAFATHTRECWVHWLDADTREKVSVDGLTLRQG